ncbi:MAG: hypothetical protein ACLGIW_06660 [Gammaproteobacteria bacterium]
MTFNTGNNVPSTDPRDLYDNAENLDKLVNGVDPFYADRKGILRESWSGMENSFNNAQEGRENTFTLSQEDKESRFQAFLVSAGYVSKGDYAASVVLAERNEYVAVDAATTGTSPGLYRPNAAATLPLTLTGTWATDSANLVLLGDDVLRQELASSAPEKGSSMLGHGVVDVASIADLLELPTEARRTDLRYMVKGYYAGSDAGGGEFYWDATNTAAANGGTILGAYTEGRFVRIYDGVLHASGFGAQPNSAMDHAEVFANIYAAVVAGDEVRFEPGEYKTTAPLKTKERVKYLGGARTNACTLKQMVDTPLLQSPNAGVGRSFDIYVSGFNLIALQSSLSPTADFRGVSYTTLVDIAVSVEGAGPPGSGAGPAGTSAAVGFDLSRGGASFNGYVKLDSCYAAYHRCGLLANVNDLTIINGAYNANRELGMDLTGAVIALIGAEVSSNGSAKEDRLNHGGVRFSGSGLFCSGVWNEYNIDRFAGIYSPNNWIIDPASKAVNLNPGRPDFSDVGVASEGVDGDFGVNYRSDIGEAFTETRAVIKNGDFSYLASTGVPKGWTLTGDATVAAATGTSRGLGYGAGVKMTHVSGVTRLDQTLVPAAAMDSGKYVGQRLLVTAVFMIEPGSTLGTSDRIGIWHKNSSGLSSGSFISLSAFGTQGQYVKFTFELLITSDLKSELAFALQLEGGAVTLVGVSASLGQKAWLGMQQTITDKGGAIYGELDFGGTLIVPTFGTNSEAVSGGLSAGQVYKTGTGEIRIVV